MEEVRILLHDANKYKPKRSLFTSDFDLTIRATTDDELGPLRGLTDVLPTEVRYIDGPTKDDDADDHGALCWVYPRAIPSAIRAIVDRTPTIEVADAIADDPAAARITWRPDIFSHFRCQTAALSVSCPERTARTVCSHLMSLCTEGRVHDPEEELRLRDLILLGAFSLNGHEVTFAFENIRKGAIDKELLEFFMTYPREHGNCSLKCVYPPNAHVPRRWRDPLTDANGGRCVIGAYGEAYMREIICEMAFYVYWYLPVHERRQRPLDEDGCVEIPREAMERKGPIWWRLLCAMSHLLGFPAPDDTPLVEDGVDGVQKHLERSELFRRVSRNLQEIGAKACASYIAVLAVLSLVPGRRIMALPVPSVVGGKPITCVETSVGGLSEPSYKIRRHLLTSKRDIPQVHPDCLMIAAKGAERLRRCWPNEVFQTVSRLRPFLRNSNLACQVMGQLCRGNTEMLTCVIPYRNPEKVYVCVAIYPETIPRHTVTAAISRRFALVRKHQRGVLHVRVTSASPYFDFSIDGSIRIYDIPYDWAHVAGTTLILKLPGFTREMGDFMSKLTRQRF
uniref:Outer capsid protein n=1 Tax=Baku virus TaxID=1484571 RepID=A0A3P8MIF6_9REOV|nr:outer capsid protein [Baku virus]